MARICGTNLQPGWLARTFHSKVSRSKGYWRRSWVPLGNGRQPLRHESLLPSFGRRASARGVCGRKLVAVLLVSALCFVVERTQAAEWPHGRAPFLTPSTRLVVFSPHPDDETLGAGGLIQRVLSLAGRVTVVFLTNGDGFPDGVRVAQQVSVPTAQDYQDYGRQRQREAAHALASLGVKERDIRFLGFPDGGLCAILSRHQHDSSPYRSPFTLADRPPEAERLLADTKYSRESLQRELRQVLTEFVPTVVVLPDPRDEHPDHCATYFFVTAAIAELAGSGTQHPRLLTFLVHWGQWPLDAEAAARLVPPRGFPASRWIALPLSAAEVETKRRALLQYHTQLLVMDHYLLSFARAEELFFLSPPLDDQAAAIRWCCRHQQ